ncbi:MAG: Na/Pi symporter [Candidatus Delongbacteria bacterium]|jgi:sodium-dependent phosphate cotransporter|nr:Na/Pi symporter [Candidatus Delongbacteria bacterium]
MTINKDLRSTIFKFVMMIFLLWVFLLSIKLFGGAFKNYFKDDAKNLIENATNNPMISLLIGILATAIIQSSSSTTSIIIAFVGAGTLSFGNAIPMIMGANIGTSVTNTIVSFANVKNPVEFRRSFASATVHDIFNILAVALFLPLELTTKFISKSALFITELLVGAKGIKFDSPINHIVKPAAAKIEMTIASIMNNPITETIRDGKVKFHIEYSGILLTVVTVFALALLFVSLKYMSEIMKSVLIGKFERILHKYVFNSMITSFIFGILFTVSVQSSSITTSMIVPLVGAGILNLNQIFPYTVGANIGTTITGILASLVSGNPFGISIALVHTLFNIFGAMVFIPLKSIPIKLSELLSKKATENKLWAVGYVAIVFFVVPISLIFISN